MNNVGNKRRCFNITGACNLQLHYMVDIRGRLEEIKRLVDDGKYFAVNRARQYGKTTTLMALAEYLKKDLPDPMAGVMKNLPALGFICAKNCAVSWQ